MPGTVWLAILEDREPIKHGDSLKKFNLEDFLSDDRTGKF